MKKMLAVVVVVVLAALGLHVARSGGGSESRVTNELAARHALVEAQAATAKSDLSVATPSATRAPVSAAAPSTASTTPARVEIRAVFERGHRPISGETVLVRLDGATLPYPDERALATDADGRAVIDDVPPGNVNARMVQGGDVHGMAQPGQTLTLLVEQPPGIRVEGEVIDVDGIGVRGAQVWSSERRMPSVGRVVATCDSSGRFVLQDVGPERYLAAKARGRALSYLQLVRGSPGDVVQVRIVLDRDGAQVRGRVIDAGGEVIPGARVLAGDEQVPLDHKLADGREMPSGAPQAATADAQGRFEIDGLPPGPITLQARAAGFGTTRVQVRVGGGETEQDIVLLDEAVVSGSVSAPDGMNLSGVEIRCGDYARFATSRAFSNPSGTFELHGLTAGDNHVIAQRTDGLRAETTLGLAVGGRAIWDPDLNSADKAGTHVLHGIVLDERRNALSGWAVLAVFENEPSRSPLVSNPSDSAGRFNLRLAGSGSFELEVYGPDEWMQFPRAFVHGVPADEENIEILIPDGTRTTAVLTGSVVDASGAPVSDACIIVREPDEHVSLEVQVDHSTGRFEVARVPPGKVQLDVHSVSWPWLRIGERTVEAGEHVDLGVIRLSAAGRIEGSLAGARDESVAGVELSIWDAKKHSVGQIERHGRDWTSSALAPGSYTVSVHGPHVTDVRADVEVVAGHDARMEFVLRDADARPVRLESTGSTGAMAWVTVRVVGADMSQVCMRTLLLGADGVAHVDIPVLPGEWTIMAQDWAGRRAETTFTQTAGGSGPEITLQLQAPR